MVGSSHMYVEETPAFGLSYGANTISALSQNAPEKRPNAPEHSISLGFNGTFFLVRFRSERVFRLLR